MVNQLLSWYISYYSGILVTILVY